MNFNIATSTSDIVEAITWVLTLSGVSSIITITLGLLVGIIILGYVIERIRK